MIRTISHVLCVLTLAGCAGRFAGGAPEPPQVYSRHTALAAKEAVPSPPPKNAAPASGPDAAKQIELPAGVKRMVIYDASIALAVFKPEEVLARARKLAEVQQGWMESMTKTRIVLRIPAGKLESFLDALSELGDLVDRSLNSKDVTAEFLDLKIRLDNALKVRQRLLALLEKSNTIRDSVMIEKELARVTEQIERFKGRIKYLKNHALFSKVTLRVQQKSAHSWRKRRLPFSWVRSLGIAPLLLSR